MLVALLNYGQVMGSRAKTGLSGVTDRRDLRSGPDRSSHKGGLRANPMNELPRTPYTRSSQNSPSTTLVHKARIRQGRELGSQKDRNTSVRY